MRLDKLTSIIMYKGLKSLLAGIVAGTALGVLFSPKKGDDVRKSFKDELDQGGTGLKTLKDTVVNLGKEIGDSAKEAYDEISETEAFKEGEKKARKYVKKAAKKATKIYKSKVTSAQRKKAKKVASDAKKVAKKAINKAAKKVADKTK